MIRILLSAVAMFAAWAACDLAFHDWLLAPTYAASAGLFRTMDQMSAPLIYVVQLTLIGCFELLYVRLIDRKSVAAGLQFGAIFGLAIGAAVGFGTYIHMPVPLALAWGWFAAGWIKMIAAGAIVGAMIPGRDGRTRHAER